MTAASKGGRPKLTIGTWGSVAVQEIAPSRYRARARYRDTDGATRTVARFGQTKKAAREALHRELQERAHGALILDRHASVELLLDRWLTEVDASERAAGTKGQYRYFVEQYVRGRLGQLSIGEATTGRVDAALQSIASEHGRSVAASCRSVLRGVFSLAVRAGALTVNPVRETRSIPIRKPPPQGLTGEQVDEITDRLRSDERAVYLDLPDLVDLALATGCRTAELLAIRDSALTLAPVPIPTMREMADGVAAEIVVPGTVEISATLVRPRRQPLQLQEHPKTAAGNRLLALPQHAVDMMLRRSTELRFRAPEGTVFSSPTRPTLRDPSNCAGDLREALNRLGYPWVTFRTFRKTAITQLIDAGLTPTEAAVHAGHAHPSITQDVYTARRVLSPRAAAALAR